MSDFESYIESVNPRELMRGLESSYAETIVRQIDYFTEKEAEERDRIVLDYFGESGINRVVDFVVSYLLSPPRLERGAHILDVGASSGIFTIEVIEALRNHVPGASFYAMDIIPIMLKILLRKRAE